jgi:hypothetical protein
MSESTGFEGKTDQEVETEALRGLTELADDLRFKSGSHLVLVLSISERGSGLCCVVGTPSPQVRLSLRKFGEKLGTIEFEGPLDITFPAE